MCTIKEQGGSFGVVGVGRARRRVGSGTKFILTGVVDREKVGEDEAGVMGMGKLRGNGADCEPPCFSAWCCAKATGSAVSTNGLHT